MCTKQIEPIILTGYMSILLILTLADQFGSLWHVIVKSSLRNKLSVLFDIITVIAS